MGSHSKLPEELLTLLKEGERLRSQYYRGRFAPSPSGPLHLGNLRTALVSWLRARLRGGEWLLRIDDLDTPRNRSGALESIQKDLSWLGLNWDGPIILQSKRRKLYESVLLALKQQGKLYPCRCSRRLLGNRNGLNDGDGSNIYPGTCRELGLPWDATDGRLPSLRLRVGKKFSNTSGDVLVRRADGFIAYHLASVSDELFLGINEVVRGEDLAKALTSQLAVIDALKQKPIAFLHTPLFLGTDGIKLSKRQGGEAAMSTHAEFMNAENLIGFLAATLDLVPQGSELSALELLSELRNNQGSIDTVLTA
ncbi:tRNA glutamyl-Q(34) synthetase GluQRS [Prochlorococcus sp. MIT 1307]|uniref:tRNA glutamyl-Q(34) synthetase GluQRS n=1 Tax=Prochlorococcus sp. MIT 1307 TaxID=3096219 RepID=UPI002A758559|nr:tRNA glutamyl-Q(34) synthetase GluQRS [Prochlorococcus sp. MIT 1307]